MTTFYRLLADLILAIHLGYVSFVVVGLLVILVGVALGWQWVRNPWFRWIHLLMISVVAFEAMIQFECPFTTWENSLRRLSGQRVEAGTFVARLFDRILFHAWPDWVYPCVYIGFALIVLATFVLAPPRYRRKQEQPRELTSV